MNLVEFPNLGLKLSIDRVAFQIFGMPVYWYGLLIALGFMAAIFIGTRQAAKFGLKSEDIVDLVLFAAPGAIIGARLYYVIFNWHEFQGDFYKIINIREGGLAIYGGVIAGILVTYAFCKVRKIQPLKLMDFGAPLLILGQAIGRWGNFINQEAFGHNTNLPWGMTSETVRDYLIRSKEALAAKGMLVDPNMPVHPTFLYESLWNFAVFAFLMGYRKKKKSDGEIICLYALLYGAGRFVIEGLRTDSLYSGSIRISQLVAGISVCVFAVIFVLLRRRKIGPESEMLETRQSDESSEQVDKCIQ